MTLMPTTENWEVTKNLASHDKSGPPCFCLAPHWEQELSLQVTQAHPLPAHHQGLGL